MYISRIIDALAYVIFICIVIIEITAGDIEAGIDAIKYIFSDSRGL